MTASLLHAVARRAEAITPDADLLARYIRERDHPAFEELVRRHGPLVWAVCRNLLPHHADAEDAFQAVFLALVRSASTIRDGRSVPAWLHGVAVRIATRARREFARRRSRERTAALPEADRSLPDGAWESLVAAVHEEVQRLPEAERTAFVLCDLQGVSQSDAAVRLGWPLGSVSGRLCKARQRLLDRLSSRGVAPAAVVGIGLTAGAASALPAKLFDAVKLFPRSPGAASNVVASLARGLTEGVAMRVKLTAAAAVMVAALGLTGGAIVLSKAGAQPPGAGGGPPPGAGFGGPPPTGSPPGAGVGAAGLPGAPPGGVPGRPGGGPPTGGAGGPPGGAGSGPGMPGMMGMGMAGFASPTVEYKFVDAKYDRKAFEAAITQQGKEGWEFCGSERFGQGELVLVFKKARGAQGGMAGMGMMMPGAMGPGGMGGGGWRDWVGGAGGGAGGVEARIFALTHRKADEVAKLLTEAHPKAVKVIGEPRTNMVIVVADPAMMKQIASSVEQFDAKPGDKPRPGGSGPLPGTGAGPGGPPPGPGPGGFGSGGMPPGPMGMGTAKPAGTPLNIFALKNARAAEIAAVLKKLYQNADIEAYEAGNSVIVRADEKTLEELKALITRLDTDSDNKRPK